VLFRDISLAVNESLVSSSIFVLAIGRAINIAGASITYEPERSVTSCDMSGSNLNWTWSDQYQNYYYITWDAYRECSKLQYVGESYGRPLTVLERPVYCWYNQTQAATGQTAPFVLDMRSRHDSGNQLDYGPNMAQMPEPGMTW
jgi:hypothetical protein